MNPILNVFLNHLFIITFLLIVLKYHTISRLSLFYVYGIFFILITLWRVSFLNMLKFFRKLGLNIRHVVILGAGPVGEVMVKFFNSDLSYGYQFLGYFDDNPENNPHKDQILGKIDDVKDYIIKNRVDEIFCALPDRAGAKVREIIEFSEEHFVRFKIIPDFNRYVERRVKIDFYDSIPIISLREEPLEHLSNRVVKRIFDIILSLPVVILILPILYIVIGILIKLDSKGPVIFKQERWGKQNKKFIALKFRSMPVETNEVDEEGNYIPVSKKDTRLSSLGKFLRKSSLDEFPQFINVLFGEMSLVGPRPHPVPLNEQAMKHVYHYNIRHLVKPGLTGWAQVNGLRGEARDPEKMKKRVEHDIWYLENWSIWLDINIFLRTLFNMARGDENAH
jgi:Undecaprenyl-phosphate glucose phosphotransferase